MRQEWLGQTSGIHWTTRPRRATVPLVATVDLDIELAGCPDGVPVEITGHGSVDTDSGRLVLEVHASRRLLLFDPALVALGLLDVLALAAGKPWPTASDAHVHVRSRTDLYDEHGREAGGWRYVAALGRTGGGLRLDGQILDHVAHIEPGERVVAVDTPWAVLAQPLEPEGVLIAAAWDARTERGNGYRAVTTTLVDGWPWIASGQVIRLGLDGIETARSSHGTSETVQLAAQLATAQLIESA